MKLFFATLQFLTRIPVSARLTADLPLDAYARGVVWLPAVGLVVGLCCALVFVLTQGVFGVPLAALFTVLFNAMITGAFHLDGLADTCDGLFSARKREQMLDIMRDSRIGTNGALALVFAVCLRLFALTTLAQRPEGALAYIICAPAVSRALIALLMYRQRYARVSGLGNVYIGKIRGEHFAATLITGLLITFMLTGARGVVAALVATLLAFVYRARINRALGGQTGDTLGCGVEVFEWLFLLAAIGVS